MTTSFRDVVDLLRALGDLDRQIYTLDREIKEQPEKLRGLQAQVSEIDRKARAVLERVTILRAQIKLRENELKSIEQKIARLKEQAATVTTNREFVAYRSELSNFMGDSDKLQGEILKIMEVVDAAETKLASFAADRTRAQDKVDAARANLEAGLEDVKTKKAELLTQRPARLKGIPPEPLQMYERVHKSRDSALAALDGEYCSACMERLTRNDQFAVENAGRLVQCRGCQRILVYEL